MSFNTLLAIFVGVGSVSIWAVIPVVIKVLGVEAPWQLVLVFRFLGASIFFFFLEPRLFSLFFRLGKKRTLMLIGLLAANYGFQTVAMLYFPASWYVTLFSLTPVIGGFLVLGRIETGFLITSGVCVLATALFVLNPSDLPSSSSPIPLWGWVCMTVGMVTWVGYTHFCKMLQKQFSDREIAALTQYASLIGVLVLAVPILGTVPSLSIITNLTGIASLGLGILTALAYWGYSYTLRISPRFGLTSQYLEPVVGVMAGVVALQEQVSLVQVLAGSVLVIVPILGERKCGEDPCAEQAPR